MGANQLPKLNVAGSSPVTRLTYGAFGISANSYGNRRVVYAAEVGVGVYHLPVVVYGRSGHRPYDCYWVLGLGANKQVAFPRRLGGRQSV